LDLGISKKQHWIRSKTFAIQEIVKQDLNEACVESWNPQKWILPSPSSGPDGVLLGDIVVVTGENLSLSSKSVPTSEVQKNYRKSSVQGFYEHKTNCKDKIEANSRKRNLVIESFQKHKIKGGIRIHFILPGPASKTGNKLAFSRGIRVQFNDELKVEELIVDIDRTNIKDCNLFSTLACTFLLDQFTREKKRAGRPKGSQKGKT
jgi:hypothetical protein